MFERARPVLSTIILLTAAACSKKSATASRVEAAERHRAEVERTFVALDALESKPLPPIASGELDYSGPALTDHNTLVLPVAADVVKKLNGNHFESTDALFDAQSVRTVALELQGHFLGEAPAEIEAKLAEFSKTKVVILVKTISRTAVEYRDGHAIAGHVVAEARLFELDGKYLGGLQVEASNSSMVSYHEASRTRSDSEASELEIDLGKNARKALHDAIAARIPGSNVPSY